MSDILIQLNSKKKQITDLQNKKARLDGQKEQLLKDLKTRFSLSSKEESEEKLGDLKKELAKNEDKLVSTDKKMGEIITQAH